MEPYQRALKPGVDAFLASDWAASEELPQFSFFPRRETAADRFYESLREIDLVRQSEEVCPEGCLLRGLDGDALHIHLTKPLGGSGDTVLVLKFKEPKDLPAQDWEEEALSNVLDLHREWTQQYSELPDERKPFGRLFGIQVFLGDSRPKDEPWGHTE